MEEYNHISLRRMDSERKFVGDFGASSRRHWTSKIKRGTLKNRAESSSFFQMAKVFGMNLLKQNKPNVKKTAAP